MRDTVSMTGAEALVDALQRAGVRCIFSLSGNQIMRVYDALLGRDIRLVHVRHEAAAVYAAEAYAQLTGEIGVALVTAGAGFGNALGALISAQSSETPVLLLSGDSPRGQEGMGAFQELDQCTMSAPVTKASLRAGSADALPGEAAGLIRTALAGRPGPVHLALPADVLTDTLTARTDLDFAPLVQALDAGDLVALRGFLDEAARPLILTGPALSNTRTNGALARAQAALNAPVLCMESPRGLRDPALGALVDVTRQADRIVLLGKQGDFTTGFLGQGMGGAGTRFAVIDPEEAAISRARARQGLRVQIAALADSLPVLLALTDGTTAPERAEWMREAARATLARAEVAQGALADPEGLHPAAVGAAVGAILRDHPEAVFISDGGEFGQWMQAIPHVGSRVINGVSGAIGAAPAYAIAASIARPDVPVIAAMGDGTAGFLLAEYETAAREGARFIAVIGNDSCWNAEHQIQIREFGPGRTHSCTLSHLARYDEAARGLGAAGFLAADGTPETLAQVLEEAQRARGPVCVNVRIRPAPAPVVASRSSQAAAVH
ncbi:thiamine pyrophosphate-binding protein [Natronohydrobacter thiooxidans]|uniref:thiamine pyrophosphate-binding protein n=1 Tax=Natronohydrobacter thiooxidans TaxID=87172 RepID=UPI000A9A7E28|nr:thiamine pyrophosphate-binding protein [Natronohydrobacter thiooxidans]